jgi:ribosome biogenesis SPOUT family RNA methylase Rps3
VTDQTITPPDLDQAILLAALVNAHNRAHEVQLAQNAEIELREFYDMELTEDDWQDESAQQRMVPDNSWL